MSAEIINISDKRSPMPGNGAREALMSFAPFPAIRADDFENVVWAEKLLMALWACGFKIVPLDGTE